MKTRLLKRLRRQAVSKWTMRRGKDGWYYIFIKRRYIVRLKPEEVMAIPPVRVLSVTRESYMRIRITELRKIREISESILGKRRKQEC